jgi:hypothetical protein
MRNNNNASANFFPIQKAIATFGLLVFFMIGMAQAQEIDLLLKGGRVLDAKNKMWQFQEAKY